MSDNKKSAFTAALMKSMGIQHYDDGGTVKNDTGPTGPSNVGGGYIFNGVGNSDPLLNKATEGNKTVSNLVNPMNSINQIQNDPNHLAGFLGVANTFQGSNPYAPSYLQAQGINQQNITQGQFDLAGALRQQMYGQGPNPAQEQFKQNTQNNIANSQGLIASQRGLNPALAARMGANAATNANSQAAGQAASIQAQQQLAAQNQLGGLYGQMQTGNLGYQHLYDAANAAAQNINAGVASQNAQANQGIVGGLFSGLGGALSSGMSMNKGGMVKGYADGGAVYGDPFAADPTESIYGHVSGNDDAGAAALEKGFASFGGSKDKKSGGGGGGGGLGSLAMLALAKGGGVPMNFMPGGSVPGKPKVSGNSPKNDTIPAMLSPGEAVIDRAHMGSRESAHARLDQILNEHDGGANHKKTMEFVDHLLKSKKKGNGYGDVVAARRKKK